jgi:hypothetical protein
MRQTTLRNTQFANCDGMRGADRGSAAGVESVEQRVQRPVGRALASVLPEGGGGHEKGDGGREGGAGVGGVETAVGLEC